MSDPRTNQNQLPIVNRKQFDNNGALFSSGQKANSRSNSPTGSARQTEAQVEVTPRGPRAASSGNQRARSSSLTREKKEPVELASDTTDYLDNFTHVYRNNKVAKKNVNKCQPFVAFILASKRYCDKFLGGKCPASLDKMIMSVLQKVAEGAKIGADDADSKIASIVESLNLDEKDITDIKSALIRLLQTEDDILLGAYERDEKGFWKGTGKNRKPTTAESIAESLMMKSPAEFVKRASTGYAMTDKHYSVVRAQIQAGKGKKPEIRDFFEFSSFILTHLKMVNTRTIADKALSCLFKPYGARVAREGKTKLQQEFHIPDAVARELGLGNHSWMDKKNVEHRFARGAENGTLIVKLEERGQAFNFLFGGKGPLTKASAADTAASLFSDLAKLEKDKEQ